MKHYLQKLVESSLSILRNEQEIDIPENQLVQIERTRENQYGDFASNIALTLTKQTGLKSKNLAVKITENLPESDFVEKIDIAGPGFINFFLSRQANLQIVKDIHRDTEKFGHCNEGKGQSVLIEFVSTNPTGPLHVGHGRSAAYGASVANLLDVTGFSVSREYYVNDAGRQMDILTISVWLRYLNMCEEKIAFPIRAYQGDYISEIAGQLFSENKQSLHISPDGNIQDQWRQAEEEEELDQIISFAKNELGQEKYNVVHLAALSNILDEIRDDLEEFGIHFDIWFSEQSLISSNEVGNCIDKLKNSKNIYEKSGALWFKSTNYGDEKDRVVVRENGLITYFASDIAYHLNKYERGFNKVINIWGADHHGYIARMKAALEASGKEPDKLEILLVQFAVLYRGKDRVPMGTRAGKYTTLRDLRKEIGNDAMRFFYITRKCEQHLDFDLELAKSQSNDNPVYYIQYAHARICSVIQQMKDRGYEYDNDKAMENLECLIDEHEILLLKSLSRYPELIISAATKYEPHQLAYYLRELANDFHSYYNSIQFLIDSTKLRLARICLILATKQVIKNGLNILSISAPEKM